MDGTKRTIELYIPSELGFEKVAMASASAVARRMGFSIERVEDLKTAISEACINAIEYGSEFDVSTKVLIILNVSSQELEVNVVDQGKREFPDTPAEPGAREDNRGWGIFLIKNLMDEVEVSKAPDGGNQIRMVIHLEKQG
jgi:serine/threonine-protein kinase RsbW